MLGDKIKVAFERVGITEERYKAAKSAIGLPPTCGCKNRQEMLNRWEEKARLWLAGEKKKEKPAGPDPTIESQGPTGDTN